MSIEITSLSNKHIKHIKSLHKRRYREKNNEFIIDGLRLVEHSLLNNADIKAVYYTSELTGSERGNELLEKMASGAISLYKVDEKILKEISTTESSQGILGIVNRKHYRLDEIINKKKFTLIILDRLQDPGNVGTIIRTADSAGVDGIVSLKGTVDIYNSKTIRSTMGSIFTVPVIYGLDDMGIINILREAGADIISTTLNTEKYHFDVKYSNKNAIIIGNEANGVSEELLESSNVKVKIPIIGNAESLNASIASAVVMYEIVRQNYFSEN